MNNLKKELIFASIIVSFLSLSCMPEKIARPEPEIISKPGLTAQQIQYEPWWGPKKRIAVMRFENKTSIISGGQLDIGNGMADQLVSALFQTGAFIILEREKLQDILGEQRFGTSGHVKLETAPKVGEMEGAELLIYGAVTDYDPGQFGSKAGIGVGGMKGGISGGAGVGIKQALVSIDLKIVDANTTRIVNATSVEGHPREVKGQLGIDSSKVSFGTAAYYKTPTGQAVRDCLNRAVDYIVKTAFPEQYTRTTLNRKHIYESSDPLFVQIWTNKREYRQGERIRIYLKGNKSFYARIIYRDASGAMLQILPNPYRAENYFKGGVMYEIPSNTDRFDLEVNPPFGEENIVLYASTSQLGDISLKPQGGVYLITTKREEISEKTRGLKIKEKVGGNERVLSEFYEERIIIETRR